MHQVPLSTEIIELQESEVLEKFHEEFGKNTDGFCDNCFRTIDLLIQGIHYYKRNDQYDEEGKFKNFNQAIRFLAYLHFVRSSYSSKAVYNCISKGYYSDAAILIRSLLETFVRLRYLFKKGNIELVHKAVAGHLRWEGKKFNITYKDQFEDIAVGSYKKYQLLCDFAHGAMTSNTLKWNVTDGKIFEDKGIVYNQRSTGFTVNYFTICLIGNLRFLFQVFPEIKENAPNEYIINNKVVSKFWGTILEEGKKGESKQWFKIMEPFTDINTE